MVWTHVTHAVTKLRKPRTVIILTPNEDITSKTEEFQAVGCSRSRANDRPRPAHYVSIPWCENGLCQTKLKYEIVACCDFPVVLNKCDILDFGGTCPRVVLVEIMKQMAKFRGVKPSTTE